MSGKYLAILTFTGSVYVVLISRKSSEETLLRRREHSAVGLFSRQEDAIEWANVLPECGFHMTFFQLFLLKKKERITQAFQSLYSRFALMECLKIQNINVFSPVQCPL